MGLERRGRVIAADLGQPVRREEPSLTRGARSFRGAVLYFGYSLCDELRLHSL